MCTLILRMRKNIWQILMNNKKHGFYKNPCFFDAFFIKDFFGMPIHYIEYNVKGGKHEFY